MEKNTVLLSLDDYNKLREFKENVEFGGTVVKTLNYVYLYNREFISKTEALDQLAKEFETMNGKLSEKDSTITNLSNIIKNLTDSAQNNTTKFKKMSLFEFAKFKMSK